MPEIVEMPKLGMTMESGTIISWLKKEGDRIEEGEGLLEVMTDKTNIEIESPVRGIVYKLLADEGEEKKVGEPIAIIQLEGEKEENIIPLLDKKEKDGAPSFEKKEEKRKETKSSLATPYARYLSKKRGIDIKDISSGDKIITGELILSLKTTTISPIQKAMSKRMEESAKIPQFTLFYEFDMENILALNKNLKEKGYNSSLTPIFLKVVSQIMEKYPLFNSLYIENDIIPVTNKNIGIAVQTERGLLVPVLKNIENLKEEELFNKYNVLIQKAKSGELDITDTEGGTITISNLGMYGVKSFRALLVPGQMAILAIGKIDDSIKIVGRDILIRKMANISISCDHRVIEGAYAAKFMESLKEAIENITEETIK